MSAIKSQVCWNGVELYYELENQKYPVSVRAASGDNDFNSILSLNRLAFAHDNENIECARKWIQHRSNNQYYLIEYNKLNIVGYILWAVKGGYKQHLVCELDQIAIDAKFRRQGFASHLIRISLIKFQAFHQRQLEMPTLKISVVFLSTGCNNDGAQNFYKKELHVEQKGGKLGALYGPNEYGEEEIIMANENMAPLVEKLLDQYKCLLD